MAKDALEDTPRSGSTFLSLGIARCNGTSLSEESNTKENQVYAFQVNINPHPNAILPEINSPSLFISNAYVRHSLGRIELMCVIKAVIQTEPSKLACMRCHPSGSISESSKFRGIHNWLRIGAWPWIRIFARYLNSVFPSALVCTAARR